MSDFKGCPEPALKPGDIIGGFRVLRIEQIPEIRVTAYEIEHEMTGAKIVHLHCEDRENLYSIGFRTPPRNSTGVPHILEHSVLAGSQRYPVKDAFNELAKGTLQTFINAFTYPDKTIYPVASQVPVDFFNLARVYTDLVLRPRLLRETFYQEGHHLEFEDPGDPGSRLTVSGIVFNEMRGAYSSADNLMYKALQVNLYPDTAYAWDAGGDPQFIPDLTYEELKEFHRTFYSPTNSRFFLYGNIKTADHLAFIAEMLSGFERISVDSRIASQPRMTHPVKTRGYYPVGKEENLANKTTVNMGWMLADSTDTETVLLLKIVSEAIVGNAAGPLRKSLIDSGLGQDLSPVTGLVSELKQVMFAVGLRGTEPERSEQISDLILRTFEHLAQEGIERDIIEGALHQIEFSGREIVRRYVPYSLILMQRSYDTWLYGGDPFAGLKFAGNIEQIRAKWESEPGLFQNVIKKWFVDNTHYVVSIFEPSNTFLEEREKSFREKMARKKASLSINEIEMIRREAAALKDIQAKPDTPEALATLPELKLSDIPREIETIPAAEARIGSIPVLRHEIFTNGIAYLDLAFDVSDIPEELQPYLSVLGKLVTGMGAAGMGYAEMAKRISLKTGGIGYHLASSMTIDGKKSWQKMVIQMKALHRNIPDAVRIIADILLRADFSDEARMRDLIYESRNRLQASVIPSGHMFARRTAASAISLPYYRDEQWNGRMQLRLLSRLSDGFKEEKRDIFEKVTFLYRSLFQKKRLFINMTGDTEGLSLLSEELLSCLEKDMEDGGEAAVTIMEPALSAAVYSGISIPAQVSYVAKVLPAAVYTDELSGALLVLSRALSNNYLYKRIRVQGGAYGAMSLYDPATGIFSFLSYRDPNLAATIRIYEEAADLAVRSRVEGKELEKAVIGTIGMLDKPMDPAGKGYTSMVRYFSGLDDEKRRTFRSRIFEATPELLLEAAGRYLVEGSGSSAVAVYAAEDHLRKANEVLDRKLAIEALV
ncbi:MAG: insulinase family protein [Syntrophales bacterium]